MSQGPERKDGTSRRSLLGTAAAAGVGVGLGAHVLAWGRSLFPNVLYEPSTTRRLGPPENFPEGVTFLREERVFVVREPKRLRAISAVCTHLGCTVSQTEDGFHCPCHGSRFLADGTNVSGPAPRPLPWHPLTKAGDGSLVVDLAVGFYAFQRFKRPTENPGS